MTANGLVSVYLEGLSFIEADATIPSAPKVTWLSWRSSNVSLGVFQMRAVAFSDLSYLRLLEITAAKLELESVSMSNVTLDQSSKIGRAHV